MFSSQHACQAAQTTSHSIHPQGIQSLLSFVTKLGPVAQFPSQPIYFIKIISEASVNNSLQAYYVQRAYTLRVYLPQPALGNEYHSNSACASLDWGGV